MTILLLGLLAGLIAWDVTKEPIFAPFRDWVHRLAARTWGAVRVDEREYARLDVPKWVRSGLEQAGYLVGCPFCFSHWSAALVLLLVRPEPAGGSWLISWGAVTITAMTWIVAQTVLLRAYRGGDG